MGRSEGHSLPLAPGRSPSHSYSQSLIVTLILGLLIATPWTLPSTIPPPAPCPYSTLPQPPTSHPHPPAHAPTSPQRPTPILAKEQRISEEPSWASLPLGTVGSQKPTRQIPRQGSEPRSAPGGKGLDFRGGRLGRGPQGGRPGAGPAGEGGRASRGAAGEAPGPVSLGYRPTLSGPRSEGSGEGRPLASQHHHCRVVRPPPGQRLFPSLSAALFLPWPRLPLQSLTCNHGRSIMGGAGTFLGGNPQILSTE